jgi:hypothetical protein
MGEETELLSTVIEFSIGLAGFSGVVAAMGRNAGWSELERYRVVNLLQAALAPAFLSFAALGLAYLQPNSASAWQQACFISGCIAILFVVRVFLGKAALPPGQMKDLRLHVLYILTGLLSSMGVIQLLAATGYFSPHTFIVFYTCLVLFLGTGAMLFAVAIFSSRQASTD